MVANAKQLEIYYYRLEEKLTSTVLSVKRGVLTCNFQQHVFSYGPKDKYLEESVFILDMLLGFNKIDRLESIEKNFQLK